MKLPVSRWAVVLVGVVVLAGGCAGGAAVGDDAAAPMPEVRGAMPETARDDQFETLHGREIPIPYRWMENGEDPRLDPWIDAQNRWTDRHLDAVPGRAGWTKRLGELWSQEGWSVPRGRGGVWIWRHDDGVRNQPVLMVADQPDGEGRVLLDPNPLSPSGTLALGPVELSPDGKLLAWASQRDGSDWMEWRVMEVETGRHLADLIRWSKFAGVAWHPDGSGFFYQRYPEPPVGDEFALANSNAQLCFHALGAAQAEDQVVYERPDQPGWGFSPYVTRDGHWLVIDIWEGSASDNRVAVVDLGEEEWSVRALLFDGEASWRLIEIVDDEALFVTDDGAALGRVVAVNLHDPERRRELVAEQEHPLRDGFRAGDGIVLQRLQGARHVLVRHALDGSEEGAVNLPEPGSIAGVSGEPGDHRLWFGFESMTRPQGVWRCDLRTGLSEPARLPELAFDPADFETGTLECTSPDGTPVRLFVLGPAGFTNDRPRPTVLYGYGGFDIPITPRFTPEHIALCESGALYVQAVLRGGGEFGREWHEAGMLDRKQNVFDDFLAAARFLIDQGYTSPEQLAIRGRSNGGLLVGAAITQAPELFGAALPEVGVLDMLRYHLFTIGAAWAPEYGSADDATMFPHLLAYSPLHNVVEGTRYPATMLFTGDHDDRVVPVHSYKFAAALQAAQGGDAPILLRVSRAAGHGAGKPKSLLVDEAVDRFAFLARAIGLRPLPKRD